MGASAFSAWCIASFIILGGITRICLKPRCRAKGCKRVDEAEPMLRMFKTIRLALPKFSTITQADLDRYMEDENALCTYREVEGSGFDARMIHPRTEWDFSPDSGGFLTLNELELSAGGKIEILYDFGDDNEFTVKVMAVRVEVPSMDEYTLQADCT